MQLSRCEVCGNDYDKTFQIIGPQGRHTFDSFECAISALAPTCPQCGCRVLGHGVEANERIFCGAHCAGRAGASGLRDRA